MDFQKSQTNIGDIVHRYGKATYYVVSANAPENSNFLAIGTIKMIQNR